MRERIFLLKALLVLVIFCLIQTVLLSQPLKLGIDNLVDTDFEILRGKKIALLTNSACRTSTLVTTPETFLKTKTCTLTTLLTPEHGYYAGVPAGESVEDDTLWNIPVFSLYGKNRRPTREMLTNCDAVVADIQDIGIRSYTFISTLMNVMDACAEYGKPLYVLDRPNPLGGLLVDGNIPDMQSLSFVCSLPIPYIHGCTIGELAQMANSEGWLQKGTDGKKRKCSLTVVKMKRWNRSMTWEKTGLPFIPTSPNIVSPETIRCAAITGMLGELSIMSVGIGTAMPFRWCGAPDISAENLVSGMSIKRTDSITIIPSGFYPQFGKFAKTKCNGIMLSTPSTQSIPYFTKGMELIVTLRLLYPEKFTSTSIAQNNKDMFVKVLGSAQLADAVLSGEVIRMRQILQQNSSEFLQLREKYLLYK